MIIIESRTEGIKFERHKEESLIGSQFLKNQKKSKSLTFFDFYSIISLLQWVHAIYMSWLKIEKKNVLNNKTLNKSWFGLKLANSKKENS